MAGEGGQNVCISLHHSIQGLGRPQVWVSVGSRNQSPVGGEGQLSFEGVRSDTGFVFVV